MKYLVLTTRTPQFNPDCLDAHYAYLHALVAQQKVEQFGGFSDQSGGAYVLLAKSLDDAIAIAHTDPVYTSGSSTLTIHEWHAKTH